MARHSTRRGCPVNRLGRVLLVCWSVFLVSGFALAGRLAPDKSGFGTHQQLGFPPCTFQQKFSLPCPSCGMTTAFAHFVRGEWLAAARANVGGLLLAIVCLVQVPWCLWSGCRGQLIGVRQPDTWLVWLVGVLTVVTGINWLVQLLT